MRGGWQTSVRKEAMASLKLHKEKKNIISGIFFVLLAALTFYTIFHGNDMEEVFQAIKEVRPLYLSAAALLGLFFVGSEGVMIWYLLRALDRMAGLRQCVKYSFIGFFFSAITPSATGGQPMQLYYMKKDRLKMSESTVVLMTVAVIYKFVLVLMGIGMLLFFFRDLSDYLGGYLYLYFLGLFLNIVVVAVLLLVMVSPGVFEGIVLHAEKLLVKLHIFKFSKGRLDGLKGFVARYQETVRFFLKNKRKIAAVVAFTVAQRLSVFVLTYVIYRGFSLDETKALTVVVLQASVYVAVDMLPLPGAQGITELMYRKVFFHVFPGNLLTASMCVTRGINFYFLLIVSMIVTLWCYLHDKRKKCIILEDDDLPHKSSPASKE